MKANDVQSIRFRKARITIEELRSWLRGWAPKYSLSKISPEEMGNDWYCIAEKSTDIKMRKGIGEINANRISNMKMSCAIINGIRLEPGQIFSFRKVVGEATPENGFRLGPVLIRGRLCFTYGGGLCQIASTLFNAALLANMDILEKHNHSFDIWGDERFIDLGLDATYVYGLRDLKFRNGLDRTTVIVMFLKEDDSKVCCRLVAPKPLPYEVNIETHVVKRLTATLLEGDKDVTESSRIKLVDGWIVRTSRYIQKDNTQVMTYQSTEQYRPLRYLENSEADDTHED